MRLSNYNYILNTLLRVAPFFAGTVLDQSIKKAGHTVDSISAGEMLKILRADVIPKLSEHKEFLTDSIAVANTSVLQTNTKNEIIHIEGPFTNYFEDPCFEQLVKLGFLKPLKKSFSTTVREIEFEGSLFKVSISPVYSETKSITGTVSTIANVSLQKEIEEEILHYSDNLRKEVDARLEAEDELKESQSLLFHSSKLVALGEMASGIAHEINNPLASIKLSIDLIKKLTEKEILTDEKLSKELHRQLELVDRISNTILSMKKLSRPSNDDDFKMLSVKQVISDVLTLSGEKFLVNDVDLRIDDSKEDIHVFAQETQLGQVIVNLINNAFDEIYDQFQEPWIELDWYKTDCFIYVTVTDCGLGIPIESAEKIFNPFFTGKMDKGGTGLGLSISSQIMKSHNGQLYIDHEYPNTRFVISLPIKNEEQNG